jgi:hypothetical protein
MQVVLTDRAWNAALRAAWLGGAHTGDVSPAVEGLLPAGATVTAHAQLLAPWLLATCGTAAPRLDLVDLRVHLRSPHVSDEPLIGDGDAHVAVRAKPVFKLAAGTVQPWLGEVESVSVEFDYHAGVIAQTDVQANIAKDTGPKFMARVLAEWSKAPLAELPLPTSAKPGAVRVAWSFGTPVASKGAIRVPAVPK